MSAHAPLAPSSASRWGPRGCPGSAAMERRYPEDGDSEASREGTAAHHYLTETLLERPVAVGDLAPNGFPINAEMVDAAQAYLTDVRDTWAASGAGAEIQVEKRVTMAQSVHCDNWGTPDTYLLDTAGRALHVWDYKYGHRYVDAYSNWQMIDYAIGALEGAGITDWREWRITLTIAQPRNYAPEGSLREWYLSGAALRDRAEELRVAAVAASQPDAPLQTGPHCRDCNAAHACPALARVAMLAVDLSYRQTAVDMPPEAVGLEMTILAAGAARIKARQDALEAHGTGLIRRGERVPGWGITHVKSRPRWSLPTADVVAIGRMLHGVDLAKPPEAVTPTQARKLGVSDDVIAAYTETPAGAAKLAPVDDSTAARIFGSAK